MQTTLPLTATIESPQILIEPDGRVDFLLPETDRDRPRVACSVCRWQGIPGGWIHVHGQDYPVCLFCHAAGPKPGEVAFCVLCQEQGRETPLTAIQRIEPGGCLVCPACLKRWQARRKAIVTRNV